MMGDEDIMNRIKFVEMITSHYFTMEEGRNIQSKGYETFPIEKTQMVIEMKRDDSRVALASYLLEERNKDDWGFITEEFASCLIQMLSTNRDIPNLDSIPIDKIEALYYTMLEGLLEAASLDCYDEQAAKAPYVAHMEDLRNFFMTFMDIKKLNKE